MVPPPARRARRRLRPGHAFAAGLLLGAALSALGWNPLAPRWRPRADAAATTAALGPPAPDLSTRWVDGAAGSPPAVPAAAGTWLLLEPLPYRAAPDLVGLPLGPLPAGATLRLRRAAAAGWARVEGEDGGGPAGYVPLPPPEALRVADE